MAAPRLLLRSRCVRAGRISAIFARSPLLATARASNATVLRQLATTTRLWQETIETPPRVPLDSLTNEPARINARSVAVMGLRKETIRREIEDLMRSKGLDSIYMLMRLDRFTFLNDKRCFIEFASEEQAQRAIRELDGTEFMRSRLLVKPLDEDFKWGRAAETTNGLPTPYFWDQEMSAHEALMPVFGGRRITLSVSAPDPISLGNIWSFKRVKYLARRLVHDTFWKYGIESVSEIYDPSQGVGVVPRPLCTFDFQTKRGADQAVHDINDRTIVNCKVLLAMQRPSDIPSDRAYQIGRVDPRALKALRREGVAISESLDWRQVKLFHDPSINFPPFKVLDMRRKAM